MVNLVRLRRTDVEANGIASTWLDWKTAMAHNIEFSCPAASTQRCIELPGCSHLSRRPLRGQLQRFVRRSESHYTHPMLGKTVVFKRELKGHSWIYL
jgi:hypothetical protein